MSSSTYRSDEEKKLDEQSKAIVAVSTLIERIEKKTADKDFAGLAKYEGIIKEIERIREGINILYTNPVDLLATQPIGGFFDKLSNKRVELADKLDTLESKLKEIQENAL